MRAIIFLAVLLIVCVGCFRVATVLSPDAVAMAVGLLFGVLAGIPTVLLMRVSNRRMDDDEYRDFTSRYSDYVLAAHGIQREPPTLVVHEHYHHHDHVVRMAGGLPPLPPLPSQHRAITVEQPVRNQQNRELMVRR